MISDDSASDASGGRVTLTDACTIFVLRLTSARACDNCSGATWCAGVTWSDDATWSADVTWSDGVTWSDDAIDGDESFTILNIFKVKISILTR